MSALEPVPGLPPGQSQEQASDSNPLRALLDGVQQAACLFAILFKSEVSLLRNTLLPLSLTDDEALRERLFFLAHTCYLDRDFFLILQPKGINHLLPFNSWSEAHLGMGQNGLAAENLLKTRLSII